MAAEIARRDSVTLAARPAGALALTPDQADWSPVQTAALRQLGLTGAPPGDLQVLLHVSQTTGLDPFARQIYMIKRREKDGDRWVEKWTIQTGIDGFRIGARRAAARRNATYSYDDPEWCDADGLWRDVWLDGDRPPAAARVRVVVTGADGRVERYSGVARYGAYAQLTKEGVPTKRWRNAADQMLSKCAEALGLRMAFPLELAQVYIPEEMDQAAETPPAPTTIRQADGMMPVPKSEYERERFVAEWRSKLGSATTVAALGQLQAAIVRAAEQGYISAAECRGIQENELRPRRHGLPADQRELTALARALDDFGITDPADRVGVISVVVGRPVESSKQLTDGEARTVNMALGSVPQVEGLLAEARARAGGAAGPPPSPAEQAAGPDIAAAPAGGWPEVARPADWAERLADEGGPADER
jgi:phage recombination protein Bet